MLEAHSPALNSNDALKESHHATAPYVPLAQTRTIPPTLSIGLIILITTGHIVIQRSAGCGRGRFIAACGLGLCGPGRGPRQRR